MKEGDYISTIIAGILIILSYPILWIIDKVKGE